MGTVDNGALGFRPTVTVTLETVDGRVKQLPWQSSCSISSSRHFAAAMLANQYCNPILDDEKFSPQSVRQSVSQLVVWFLFLLAAVALLSPYPLIDRYPICIHGGCDIGYTVYHAERY